MWQVQWPSGPRRSTQVRVSSEAWVRTPPEPVFFYSKNLFAEEILSTGRIDNRHRGRVVKAPDLKSGGLCPRRFKSCRWRASIVQWLEYLPSKQVARVRFPVDAVIFFLLQKIFVGKNNKNFCLELSKHFFYLRTQADVGTRADVSEIITWWILNWCWICLWNT